MFYFFFYFYFDSLINSRLKGWQLLAHGRNFETEHTETKGYNLAGDSEDFTYMNAIVDFARG